MASLRSVLFLLLVIGVVTAFDISSYLLPGETNSTVSYTNFTYGGYSYSLIKLNGVETFLLKDGTPISNQSQIESILYSYYLDTYYPNQTEIDTLKQLVKRFNDSRNDGYDFKGKEEYLCRNEVLLSNGKISVSGQPIRCVDNATCARNALMLFSIYSEGLGLGTASVILGPLMNFTPASLKIDEFVINYSTRLNTNNQSLMFDTIDYIKSTSDELKNLSLKIESTIFRTPRLNDTADRRACDKKCWAICPSFDLDQEAIDLLKSKTSNISTRVAPLKNYATVSTLLYTRTSARLDHVKAENSATYYLGLFEPLNASGTRAIGLAELALSHVQNKSLSSKLDDLKSLHRTIPEDISKRNFTTIDSDMSQYSNLSATVETMTNSILAKYNETMAVKNTENSLLLILETKDLDPISARSLQSIKNRSADLDIQFRDGLTISQLDELKENYTQLSDKCQGILTSESKSPASRIISLMRGFARNVNTGIAQVADKTQIMPRSDIPNNPLNLGFFSAVVFISLSSIALLVFLYIFAFNKFTIPKTNHILAAAFVVVITLIFVFTALMYAFLGKTSNDATLPEFLTDFNSKSSASILLDLRNATFADAAAMSSCASSLTSSFAQKNKTWAVYTLTPTSCTITNSFGVNSSLDTTECFKNVSKTDSSFVLSYSPTTEPQKFSIIYENKAEINANLNYYQSCPLVALFS